MVVPLHLIFHWMWEDERWRYKVLLQGLILLIPVVGQIALLGWMMTITENLLAGRQDVAREGFYLRRAVKLAAIAVIYSLALSIPRGLLLSLNSSVLPVATLAAVYNNLALLLYVLLLVPILVTTDQGGLLAGFNVVHVVIAIVKRPVRTLAAALVVLLGVAI